MIRAFAKIELGGDLLSVNVGSGKMMVDSKNVASIIQRVDGSESVWVFVTTVGAIASANPVKVSGAEPSESSERGKRLHDDYLNRCDEEIDRKVFDALYHFAQITPWFSLYKVYERITFDIYEESHNMAKNEMIKDGWVDEGKLNDANYIVRLARAIIALFGYSKDDLSFDFNRPE